jgi:hypothetical protein
MRSFSSREYVGKYVPTHKELDLSKTKMAFSPVTPSEAGIQLFYGFSGFQLSIPSFDQNCRR